MRQRYIDIEQIDKHVRLKSGQITMHSEEYFDEATARRAARLLVKAINTRPMRLQLWLRGVRVISDVRKVWKSGDGPVAVPEEQVGPIGTLY